MAIVDPRPPPPNRPCFYWGWGGGGGGRLIGAGLAAALDGGDAERPPLNPPKLPPPRLPPPLGIFMRCV